jgi:hypothetical protein
MKKSNKKVTTEIELPYTPAQKKALSEFAEKLDRFFSLEGHERDLFYHAEDYAPYPECAAEIKQDDTYKRVSIHIYKRFWNNDIEQRAIYLLHEYSHSVVHAITEKAHNLRKGELETEEHIRVENERATSQISLLLYDLVRGKPKWFIDAFNAYVKSETAANDTK